MKIKTRTAVVFQGGGALGAYEYGVMKELYEYRGSDFKPDVITGVSIGAVNAAILAGSEKPIDTLDRVWREGFTVLAPLPAIFEPVSRTLIPHKFQQYLSILGNESMYRVRPEYLAAPFLAPFFSSSIYDTSPLRETLTKVLNPKQLNSFSRVVVTAVNVETGKLEKFGNALSMVEGGRFDNVQGMSIEHIMASSSLPPGFPMTNISGNSYWDGGLSSNTPLSEAINCLERCDGGSRDVMRELIVVELFPMGGRKPFSLEEVVSRIFNMIFASKLELDGKLFTKLHDYVDLGERIDFLLNTIEASDHAREAVDAALASTGKDLTLAVIRRHPGYEDLMKRRRIDVFKRIPFTAGAELTNASDFSSASIEARIEAGRQEARRQNIGEPRFARDDR